MKRFSLGKPFMALLAILLALGMAFVSCDDGATSVDNTPSGGEKTIVGVWIKTDGINSIYLTINQNNTWTTTIEDTSGTWDANGLTFLYTYPGIPPAQERYITVSYSLSADKNSLTLSGEGAELFLPGPWTRVE